jgi:hypothetical protein
MLRSKSGTSISSAKNQKNAQSRKPGRAVAPIIEMLERRMLLSISTASLVSDYFIKGATFTFAVNQSETLSSTTQTVVGPATAPGGQSATELDTANTIAGYLTQTYNASTSTGLVDYADVLVYPNGDSQTRTYSPTKVNLPATLTAGLTVTETTAVNAVFHTSTGITTSQYSVTDAYTLVSATPQRVTVPAGTFSAYQINDVLTDPGDITITYENWYAPQVGIVETIASSEGVTSTTVLSSYSVPQDTIKFVAQPTAAPVNQTLSPVSVEFIDPNSGKVDTNATSAVTLTLKGGSGTLSGTATVDAVGGVATFSNLSINVAGNYTLDASTSGSSATAASNPFTIGAAALTWTGGGDGTSWSDPKNWSQDQAPISGDSLVFPGGSPRSPNNDISGLTIDSIDIQGSGYDLTGAAISLSGGLTSEAGNNTYDIATTLVGSPTIDDQTGDLTIKSTLSGGALTVSGNGTFNFTQNDTYTGGTTLSAGVTIDDNDIADEFGNGSITIGAGSAAVNIDDTGTSPAAITNNIAFQNGSTLAVDPEVILSGSVTVAGSDTVDTTDASATMMLDGGAIQGAGTLTFEGAGVAVLDDAVPATVLINVISGKLQLAANLQGTSGDQIVVSGGTVVLLGTTKGSGGITVTSGILATDPSNGGGVAGYSGTITLDPKGTIKDYDTKDSNGLGTGTLDLKGGLLQNSTGGNAEIDNNVTLEGSVTLSDPSGSYLYLAGMTNVTATSVVTVNGSDFLLQGVTSGSTQVSFAGAGNVVILNGVGAPVEFGNDGFNEISGVVAAGSGANGTNILVDSAGTTLELISDAVKAVDGIKPGTLSGSGGIEVEAGTLVTAENAAATGVAGYSGTITLDPNGTIKDYDTKDGIGLGTGTLDLKGGLLQNSTGGNAEIDNDVTLEGSVTLSSPSGSYLYLAGVTNVTSLSRATLGSGGDLILHSVSGSTQVLFDGTGNVVILNGIGSPVAFTNSGFDEISGAVAASSNASFILVNDAATTLELISDAVKAVDGIKPSPLTGSGGIEVEAGTLVTAENAAATGVAGYSGTITLDPNGTIKDYDTKDGDGFGTGNLILGGGVLQNSTGTTSIIGNPVVVQGNSTISSPASRLKLSNSLAIQSGQTLTVVGSLALTGSLFGTGSIDFTGDQLAIAGSNPNFSGNVMWTSGIIEVANNNALGTGTISTSGNDELESVSTIGDPVMDNPLTVKSGTLILDGQFTFPQGITVDAGATLEILGAGSSAVVTGPLSGGGNVVMFNGGTFSTPGGTSGFTGNIQTQSGKITPTVTVTDAGGVFNGSPFPATPVITSGSKPRWDQPHADLFCRQHRRRNRIGQRTS